LIESQNGKARFTNNVLEILSIKSSKKVQISGQIDEHLKQAILDLLLLKAVFTEYHSCSLFHEAEK